MNNVVKYCLYSTIWVAVNMVVTGTVFQSFLMEHGFTEELTNIVTSFSQVISIAAMLLFSPIADKVRNIIHATANTYLLYLPLLLVLIAICLYGSIPTLVVILLFIAVMSSATGFGLLNCLTYKLPYAIMDISRYGRITSVSGLLSGVFGLLVSALLTWLIGALGYQRAMTSTYLTVIPLALVTFALARSLKPTYEVPVSTSASAEKFNYFRFKPFSHLILPNLMRGFGTGILNVSVTIGYYCGCIDSESAAIMVVISNFTTLLGCGIYGFATGRLPERLIILLSSLGIAAAAPFMVLGNNTVVFLVFYGLTSLFLTVTANANTVAVVQIANYSIMGQYSSGRVLLLTLGNSLAGFVCIPLIRLIGVLPTMLLTSCMFFFCGFGYYGYMKKNGLR